MNNRLRCLGLALVAGTFSGCATVDAQQGEGQASRRTKDSDLYVTGSRLPRKSADLPAEVGQVLNSDWRRYAPPAGLQGMEPPDPAIRVAPKSSGLT
jgi:hypothetical protein